MSALNGFLEPGAGTSETVAQLRADLAAREREVEGLRAQGEGLRGVLAIAQRYIPDFDEETISHNRSACTCQYCVAWRDGEKIGAALSATPVEHRSQAFQRGLERAAEDAESRAYEHRNKARNLDYEARDCEDSKAEALEDLAAAIRAEAARLKEQA